MKKKPLFIPSVLEILVNFLFPTCLKGFQLCFSTVKNMLDGRNFVQIDCLSSIVFMSNIVYGQNDMYGTTSLSMPNITTGIFSQVFTLQFSAIF